MEPSQPPNPTPPIAPANLTAPSDLQLMQALAARDRTAIGTLYDRHAPLLLALCRRILRDAAEADDVLGDVFYELWQRAGRFDASRGSAMTYLLTLTRSRAIDRKRSLGSRPALRSTPESAARLGAFPATDGDPHHNSANIEQQTLVRQALSQLDPQQRQALECAFFDGLSHTEIAQTLDKPLGTVKTYIRQGLIRLRAAMRTSNGE